MFDQTTLFEMMVGGLLGAIYFELKAIAGGVKALCNIKNMEHGRFEYSDGEPCPKQAIDVRIVADATSKNDEFDL